MKLNKLVEAKKIMTGVSGKFKPIKRDKSTYMMFVTNDNKKYVLKKSLKNYLRFAKWSGKKATVDLRKEGSVKINDVRYPLVKIRTVVTVEGEPNAKKETIF